MKLLYLLAMTIALLSSAEAIPARRPLQSVIMPYVPYVPFVPNVPNVPKSAASAAQLRSV